MLALFRGRGLHPASLLEVRELQTALGLVAAGLGLCLVPAAVQRLQRDGVAYRALDEPAAVSPIIMSRRAGDASAELELILDIIKTVYRREGLVLGQ